MRLLRASFFSALLVDLEYLELRQFFLSLFSEYFFYVMVPNQLTTAVTDPLQTEQILERYGSCLTFLLILNGAI